MTSVLQQSSIANCSFMLRIFYLISLIFLLNISSCADKTQEVIIAKTKKNISFNSIDGRKRLAQSRHSNDFYQLINFYQPQINPILCSAASSVIVLNAINYGNISSQKSGEVIKPKALKSTKLEYKLYNQIDFFNNKTDKIKKKEVILFQQKDNKGKFDAGLSLTDLSKILAQSYNLEVEKVHANNNDKVTINKFREDLITYLSDDTHFILANFNGKKLGMKTGGHISPIAAYDQETDSVLVLDVATHKELWSFIPLERLYNAMHSKDNDTYRGYLIVSK